jgi:alkyl sulfatase BDS1-like metallo-beta-lactamase superfamily hydrolase
VVSSPPDVFVTTLRVLLVPERAAGVDDHLRFVFDDGTRTGLHVRRGVAVPTDGSDAELEIELELETWASLLTNGITLGDAIEQGDVRLTGDAHRIRHIMQCFDLPSMEIT